MTSLYYKGFSENEMDIFESMLKRIFDNLKEIEP